MEAKPNVLLSWVRRGLSLLIALIVILVPLLYYRCVYTETKRLRVVAPGKFYRSGMMTANGLENAIQQFGIKTVINLMEEDTEPALSQSYFGRGKVAERDVCEKLGAKYIFLQADLTGRREARVKRPKAIDEFLEIVRDPANQPVLIHCRAGLHRTGVLTAAYRMEVDHWSPIRAWEEMRDNGFGEFNCYRDNDYIVQYIIQPSRSNQDVKRKAP
jgi:hypothetical protein